MGNQKRHVRSVPFHADGRNEASEHLFVGSISTVVFALIPQETPSRVRADNSQHGIVECGRPGFGAITIRLLGLRAEFCGGSAGFFLGIPILLGSGVFVPRLFVVGRRGEERHFCCVLIEKLGSTSGDQSLAIHPRLDGSSSEGTIHQADNDTEFFAQFSGEKITDRAELACRSRHKSSPKQRRNGITGVSPKRNFKFADSRIVGCLSNGIIKRRAGINPPLHIGLSGANPNLANRDIADPDFLIAFKNKRSIFGSWHGWQSRNPFAVRHGGGRHFSEKLDGNGFSIASSSPNGNRLVALQNGPV